MSEPEEFMPGGGQYWGHSDFELPAPNTNAAKNALKPILKAGRMSRFRLLDVACVNPAKQHRLVQVVCTADGPVVVGRGPLVHVSVEPHGGEYYPEPEEGWTPGPVSWEATTEHRTRGSRQEEICCFLDDLLGIRGSGSGRRQRSVRAQCRCRTADIWGPWLAGHIESGRRRVVFEGETDIGRVKDSRRTAYLVGEAGHRRLAFE